MKCRFFLLDINEDRSEAKPTVRLWGVDDAGNRVLILCSMMMPYFHFAPDGQQTVESARERIAEARSKFPKILQAEVQQAKLLGRECEVLKLTCSEQGVVSSYAMAIRKMLQGSCYEDDLRLSVRYLIDSDLTPCGWQDFEVKLTKTSPSEPAVDRVFVAETLPSRVVEHTLPKLRFLAFSLLTASERGSANPKKDPIRAIAVAVGGGKVEAFVNEGEDDSKVISEFVAFHNRFDPDLVVGFETNDSAWPYLIRRSALRQVKLRLGRDGSEPHTSLYGHVSIAGRVNLDLSDIARGIPEIKVKTIENLAKHFQTRSVGEIETIDELERYHLWVDLSHRKGLVENVKRDTVALLELAEAAINFPMQMSALTGLPLDQAMTAAVGFRVDSYLMKQAHALGELIPRRVEQPYFTYRGAVVLEPETGIHEKVVVLDFSSMYPRLMEKYNLSPDTLVKAEEKVSDDSVFTVPEVGHRFLKEPDGFYRTVLRGLINERDRIKGEIAKAGKSTVLRVLKERERAVKIVTNACYGYAGWAGARWYAREVAESAAAIGRDTITRTVEKAKKIGLKVIYGDTDSIFVKDDPDKVDQLVRWVDDEFGLEIKREKEYVRVLFTEAMKRYAGLLPDNTLDKVGLEVVRGDWSDIARKVQEQVLLRILRDQSTEKAIEDVRATISKIKNGEVAMSDLTIRKTLIKRIEDYKVRAPHVEVAKQLVREGWDLGMGDKVAYVIVKGPGQLFKKAKPLGGLGPRDIDVEYYVGNQIRPAAMRILERFGVGESQLAV